MWYFLFAEFSISQRRILKYTRIRCHLLIYFETTLLTEVVSRRSSTTETFSILNKPFLSSGGIMKSQNRESWCWIPYLHKVEGHCLSWDAIWCFWLLNVFWTVTSHPLTNEQCLETFSGIRWYLWLAEKLVSVMYRPIRRLVFS